MRYVIAILCLSLLIGCGSPPRKLTEEEKRLQEEREAQDQPKEYKAPDGAFGAKDYANEARQSSEKETKDLEAAVEESE
jgi:starvation-inducible outer membrane lipoprotein